MLLYIYADIQEGRIFVILLCCV